MEVQERRKRLTLDWNCVIEVEEGQKQASYVQALIDCHRAGSIEVGLLAASASEHARSKRIPGSARLFIKRVKQLGWDDLPIVPVPLIWDMTYWDYSYYSDDDSFEKMFSELWAVMASNVAPDPRSHLPDGEELTGEMIQSPALYKWRNSWCDVMSAYCHIKEQRDVFVTLNTRDFQKNQRRLHDLGMKLIYEPRQAVEFLSVVSNEMN